MDTQPRKRRRWPVLVVLAPLVLILAWVIIGAANGPDLTPAEEQFISHQSSSLDDEEAVRYGNAICGMLDSGGQTLTVEWLAGVDELSRIGAVKPVPDPISMYDARQIVQAADGYLSP